MQNEISSLCLNPLPAGAVRHMKFLTTVTIDPFDPKRKKVQDVSTRRSLWDHMAKTTVAGDGLKGLWRRRRWAVAMATGVGDGGDGLQPFSRRHVRAVPHNAHTPCHTHTRMRTSLQPARDSS